MEFRYKPTKTFSVVADMMDITSDHKWLLAIENLNKASLMIHKIELYWNGGDGTYLDKSEFNLSLSQERPSNEELNSIELESGIDNINIFRSDESSKAGLTSYIDQDSITKFPIWLGKTSIKPDIKMDTDSVLFIGGDSPSDGKISIVVKGWLEQEIIQEIPDGIN